jgi:hypothetical protein
LQGAILLAGSSVKATGIEMPPLTDRKLLEIISDTESDRAEFKESLSGDAPTRIR